MLMMASGQSRIWHIQSDTTLNIKIVGPKTEPIDQNIYHEIIYVSMSSGSDKTGKGTKQNPWQTVTFALSKLTNASDPMCCALFVAAGTYDQGTILMKEYVDLYGGFNPETWERDIETNRTILDGESARRVVVGASNARLDGFMVANGLSKSHGGGILCDDTSPLISNNYIINNAVLEPSDFNHQRIHQEGNHGGGIACMFNAVPQIRNNVFYGNRTFIGYGAGVVFYGWVRIPGAPETTVERNIVNGGVRAKLENNVFVGNIAGVNDLSRTRSSSGGAIACAYEARPEIINNVVVNNIAKGRSDAGGIYNEYFSYPLIKGNWILGNISDDDGGGFYTMKLGHPILEKNIFAGNWTRGGGVGGIRLSKEGRATLIDNIIVHNPGGGVRSVDSYMEIEDNIIMHNPGEAGLAYSNLYSYMQPAIVRGNIIRENEKGAFLLLNNAGPAPLFEKNNVDDRSVSQGTQNFDHPPKFIDDRISGQIKEISFDPLRIQSRVKIGPSLSDDQNLTGRVLRIGERWGVIIESHDRTITVWGELQASNRQDLMFEILPTYSID
jgi:hypothetical protein